MKQFLFVIIIVLFVYLTGCSENPPSLQDGNSTIKLIALWNDPELDSTQNPIPLINAKVIVTSEYGIQIFYTDNSGSLNLSNLPASTYNISIRMPYSRDPNIILIGSIFSVSIKSGQTFTDTVVASPFSNDELVLNEVYYVGPVNSISYYSDQFIELYNSSSSIKYLDGIMVMRFSGNNELGNKGPGADEGNDADIDGVSYIYKFPGKPGENNYPFFPKTFLTLAVDAVNHKNITANSIDLSHADWEFYNQYATDDIDNPSVPNLINLRSEIKTDFIINLNFDIIVISKGIDSVWQDGINITDIIDGVEFQPSASQAKTLDQRVDRGYVIGPSKYSGKSIQRREPGIDTNNSLLDWDIIQPPTPGYQ
ncbi:MAG: DUF4876 domain-containing protein [Ignavibacteriales bacterium]|nr:DUF4876 domain-containing protein [Ignavibacteriales bacterium]